MDVPSPRKPRKWSSSNFSRLIAKASALARSFTLARAGPGAARAGSTPGGCGQQAAAAATRSPGILFQDRRLLRRQVHRRSILSFWKSSGGLLLTKKRTSWIRGQADPGRPAAVIGVGHEAREFPALVRFESLVHVGSAADGLLAKLLAVHRHWQRTRHDLEGHHRQGVEVALAKRRG